MVVQWLRLHLPMQGVWVPSLVGELRPHVPHGQKNKTQNKISVATDLIKTLKMVHINAMYIYIYIFFNKRNFYWAGLA